MTLYQVVADDFDGTPHGNDLFVRADTPQEAVEFWRSYYTFDEEDGDPVRVDEIPADGPSGPIDWSTVPCVWWPKEQPNA